MSVRERLARFDDRLLARSFQRSARWGRVGAVIAVLPLSLVVSAGYFVSFGLFKNDSRGGSSGGVVVFGSDRLSEARAGLGRLGFSDSGFPEPVAIDPAGIARRIDIVRAAPRPDLRMVYPTGSDIVVADLFRSATEWRIEILAVGSNTSDPVRPIASATSVVVGDGRYTGSVIKPDGSHLSNTTAELRCGDQCALASVTLDLLAGPACALADCGVSRAFAGYINFAVLGRDGRGGLWKPFGVAALIFVLASAFGWSLRSAMRSPRTPELDAGPS